MWPRFRLTPEEAQYCQKYEDPTSGKSRVLRKLYPGEINITSTIRQDSETFQISRRSRIFALTASGDTNMIEVQIIDISGEQYTTDFIPFSLLIGGDNWDPRSSLAFNTAVGGLNTGSVFSFGSLSPYVFEPSIVLASNQTLTFNARTIDPLTTDDMHIDFCLHVWEFPGMPGSPL